MTDAIDTIDTATKPGSMRPRKMAREPKVGGMEQLAAQPAPAEPKPQSKASLVLDLLRRPDGATIEQLVAATGWLPHTTRAALTGIKKKGHVVTSEKVDGGSRVYRISAPPEKAAPPEKGVAGANS